VFNGDTAYITQLKNSKNQKGAFTLAARRHNVNVLLRNTTSLIFAVFYLCDVGRVAVKHCFKPLSLFTFVFAVLLQFADRIKFTSGLNTVVFSDCDCP